MQRATVRSLPLGRLGRELEPWKAAVAQDPPMVTDVAQSLLRRWDLTLRGSHHRCLKTSRRDAVELPSQRQPQLPSAT